jgi:ribose 5-phosphate isomerase B
VRPTPVAAPAVVVGADHAGTALKEAITARLRELGARVGDVSATAAILVDYADLAVAVAREVAAGRARLGIMVDGSGVGSCMAANKVPGVRAAMCHDVTSAASAREYYDANVLTLGSGLVGPRLALAIVETFLTTSFADGPHASHVAKIDALGYGS